MILKEFPYPVTLFYSEEDESFIADIRDLKYCSAFGETPEKAIKEIQVALAGFIEVAKKNGLTLPKPSESLTPEQIKRFDEAKKAIKSGEYKKWTRVA